MKLRAVGRGLRDNRLDFADMKIAPRAGGSGATSRAVSFARGELAVSVPIVGRDALGSVARPGPLIVEEFDATVVVPPDATVHCDAIGCIVVEIAP
jgi:N-methylhydantoinase A